MFRVVCLLLLSLSASAKDFEFALIGDAPYGEALVKEVDKVIQQINADKEIKWTIHVGDIKSGSTLCSDQMYANRKAMFDRLNEPFFLSMGDNEWTDCHRASAGKYKPLERLARLREVFYPYQQSFLLPDGKTKVELQSDDKKYSEFIEHQRWMYEGILFLNLHIVGSKNAGDDFEGRTDADDKEVVRRTQAAMAWLKDSLNWAKQQGAKGAFIFSHADMFFYKPELQKAFRPFLDALPELASEFNKPVLWTHGDSHRFIIDKPIAHPKLSYVAHPMFTRLETFGAADVHWLRVIVQPDTKHVFSVVQEINSDLELIK